MSALSDWYRRSGYITTDGGKLIAVVRGTAADKIMPGTIPRVDAPT